MKTRNGFVSNSSSSSFIVKVKDYFGAKSVKKLTKDQIKKIEKFGFRKTVAGCPDSVDNDSYIQALISRNYFNYGYTVTCNQDEPIEFLLKNRISFEAEIHYGHESWYYDGETDKLIIGQNVGKQISYVVSSNNFDIDDINTKDIIKQTTGKEYLEEEKRLEDMLKDGGDKNEKA